jgi:hypothetical protein
MTTFQEPQPQSRRAVRQSERGDGTESSFPSLPGQPPFSPTTPLAAGQPDSRDMWDTTARRAALLSSPETPAGRRAAPRPATPGAEPLTYSTQQRPIAPVPVAEPEQPRFRSRGNAPARPVADAAALAAPPAAPTEPSAAEPAYRPRDFSPGGGGRRAAGGPQAAAAQGAVQPGWTQPIEPSDLDYYTEARQSAAATPSAPVTAPEGPTEHTLSRREMRALREQTEGFTDPPTLVPPPAPPAPSVGALPTRAPEPDINTGLTVALTEFDRLTESAPSASPTAAPVAPASVAQDPVAQAPVPQAPFAQAPVAQAPVVPAPLAQAPVAPSPVAPAPVVPAQAAPPLVDSIPVALAPAAPAAPVRTEPATPARGHWAADIDDEDLYESTISRTVGSTPSTTNALVLPSAPVGSDIRGALTSTGEIMLTGSIDLPAGLATTGASSSLEHHAIDALFDSHDAEVITTDSAPVRAIKAVSTHNSGQGVTHTQKPKGTRALTALVIAAASMAVIVAGLLVVAITMNIF